MFLEAGEPKPPKPVIVTWHLWLPVPGYSRCVFDPQGAREL